MLRSSSRTIDRPTRQASPVLYSALAQKGNANRATLAVARKPVAYLMAVDRGQRNFQVVETNCIAA